MQPRDSRMRRAMGSSSRPPGSRYRFGFKGKLPAETQRPLNNLRQPECSKPAENGKPGKVRLPCDAYRRTDLSLDLFQTVGVAQSADFNNTTANHIERGIHRLADNHPHRVFSTHHCTSCLSPRTKGTLAFILTCLSYVYAKSTSHKDQPSFASQVARGRFELPSAGDPYPIHEGIQSPLGTLACLARNVHAMLDHYTTGLRRLGSSPVFIRGFRVRTRGSLYTCRKAYMTCAVHAFTFLT